MPYTPWREIGLKERVAARAAELGKTVSQIMSEAGMGHDTLDKMPPKGRIIDTYEKLARALDWSIAQVMDLDLFTRIDPRWYKEATLMAQRVLRQFPDVPDDMIYEEATAILNVMIAQQLDGYDPLNRNFLRGMEQKLLDELRRHRKRAISTPDEAVPE